MHTGSRKQTQPAEVLLTETPKTTFDFSPWVHDNIVLLNHPIYSILGRASYEGDALLDTVTVPFRVFFLLWQLTRKR